MPTLGEADGWLIAGSIAALLAGGLVKGTIGIGLPLVAAPVLATLLGVRMAVAVLTLPVLLSNLFQAWHGGNFSAVLRRFWPLIITMVAAIALSTQLLVTLDERILFLALGIVVVLYPLTVFLRIDFRVGSRAEPWTSSITGIAAGLLAGLAYFFGPPLAIYFSALRLPKELFVASVSTLGFIASVCTGLFLTKHQLLNSESVVVSALAAVPTLVGIGIGTWLRRFVDERRFRQLIALALVVIGLNLMRKALV